MTHPQINTEVQDKVRQAIKAENERKLHRVTVNSKTWILTDQHPVKRLKRFIKKWTEFQAYEASHAEPYLNK